MSPETLILIGGAFNLGFLVFHVLFYWLFNWDQDLKSLTLVNRQVMQILNLSLTFVFAIFAYISIFHASEMLASPLGESLLLLISVFWWLRAAEQVVFFGLAKPVSIVFFVIFVCGGFLYAIPWYSTIGT
jgi:hypothetical protein